MKILILTHGFPPHHTAGTESYAADLGVALAERGHEVRVFTAHKDISVPNYRVTRREWRGLVVHEIHNNLFHREFEETYANTHVEAAFEDVLAEFEPDVLHVQHLLYLSGGCIAAARARGAVVVFTLHDFWLECPRFGQRVHADGGLCDTIDFRRCGTCLPSFKFGNTGLVRTVGGMIAGIKSGTGIDLGPMARSAAKNWRGQATGDSADAVDDETAQRFEALARERTQHLQRAVVPEVDLFLSPSRFLRDRFVREWNIPPARIEYLRFGMDVQAPPRRERALGGPLRVAFLGSLVPLKGAHILIEAWSGLAASVRARGELKLYGPARHHPEYQDALARAAEACGAILAGKIERDEVLSTLAETDLLVVPSLWFENAPLVILEALAARTPLLVSNLGGMAELVESGVSGFHFEMGNAQALATTLQAALEGRLGLERLYAHPPEIPTFRAHVDVIEAHYATARARGRMGA
ncbi:MAG: glycosyltransferase [Planctomycetes bacterium]|nr:glycosyltransferase [Planctomycetota bacterium]